MIQFLYGTPFGRLLLKVVIKTRLDRIIVKFLRSSWSIPFVSWYVKRHGIPVTKTERSAYSSFREFFVRKKPCLSVDPDPSHLISPCDGWMRAFPIKNDSCFSIKNSSYRIMDLLQDKTLAENYRNGICLIFRLCASDYHHYCYIDDGFQGQHHYISGILHSVQPIACEKFPVYILNKRCWSLLTTEHFGPVVQCEVGALIVGGIFNEKENVRFCKGAEKGHFELAGSTIVLLFEPDQIKIRPKLISELPSCVEIRVRQGQWIGTSGRSDRNDKPVRY